MYRIYWNHLNSGHVQLLLDAGREAFYNIFFCAVSLERYNYITYLKQAFKVRF